MMRMEYRGWALSMLLCVAFASDALAQSNPRYIPFSPRPVKGALYAPDSGPAPHVGILIVHRTSNFMSYDGCGELASRGYLVLCMTPRSDNNEAAVRWGQNALDVKTGMEFLRGQPGIRSVLLWGFSGGGGTTSFYQAVAENGPKYCQGPNKIYPCGDELAGLPPADGLILVDSNHGIAYMAILRLNAAVTNDAEIIYENRLPQLDPTLDPFRTENGFNPHGASTYSEDFKKRYFEAQARRMSRLIEIAQDKLEAIETRQTPYPDDDIFVIPKTELAELMRLDPSIHHSTERPQKLLRNDGQVVRQIVASVRSPEPELAALSDTFASGTLAVTLRAFLSANAMRARDSMNDVDYCSSNNSTPCAVQSISVPLLITAMQANRYLRFNEIHYELAKSEDKDYVIIEGALHYQAPCVTCESYPGQYSNARRNFFDYVSAWIDERY